MNPQKFRIYPRNSKFAERLSEIITDFKEEMEILSNRERRVQDVHLNIVPGYKEICIGEGEESGYMKH